VNTIKQSDFQSFAEFYPYYLQEHGNPTCRRLHVVGTTLQNRPATFQHPWYSLMGDFVMYKDILTRRIDW